jgi:hypothetical protein
MMSIADLAAEPPAEPPRNPSTDDSATPAGPSKQKKSDKADKSKKAKADKSSKADKSDRADRPKKAKPKSSSQVSTRSSRLSDAVDSPIEENTLGASPLAKKANGRKAQQGPARGNPRIIDEHAGSLGTGLLGVGAMSAGVTLSLFQLARFVQLWPEYPVPLAAAVAWLLFAVILVTAGVVIRRNDDRMPDWMFIVFLVGLAAVIGLDLFAIWPLGDVAGTATASVAAGIGLVTVVGVRSARELWAAAAVVGTVLLAADLLDGDVDAQRLVPTVAMLCQAVLPALLGALIVRSFRRMVTLELDRVLVQSTVSAPRYAVGMLASEELARLDLAAEQLLEGVASGATSLPLEPKLSQRAASLATELRLHLIEGRRETWLHHAITESDLLGRSVTLSDPGTLAGLLDPRQRDGLFSAVWLLAGEAGTKAAKQGRTLKLTLGPVTTAQSTAPLHKVLVPISIETTGVARGRVDPATWDAVRRVGKHVDSMREGSLFIEIDCIADNPADS